MYLQELISFIMCFCDFLASSIYRMELIHIVVYTEGPFILYTCVAYL